MATCKAHVGTIPGAPAKLNRRLVVTARFSGKKKEADKQPATSSAPRIKESFVSQTLNALDFAAPRSKRDADLLYEAKYGKRGEDGKMTPEQYAALRRKVVGTAKDYWKDWVEEDQVKNIKTYYKPDDSAGTVPYLPFLIGVLVSMIGVTALVVQQTS